MHARTVFILRQRSSRRAVHLPSGGRTRVAGIIVVSGEYSRG